MRIRPLLFTLAFTTLLGITPCLVAQSFYFNFGNTPYYEMNGNYLSLNEAFDDTVFQNVPIGFNFRYGGRSWDKIHISSNGQLFFGDDPSDPDPLYTIIPFSADLTGDIENRNPGICYAFGGCAGAFLMKIQFSDCSFKGGTAEDFVNFQVWLYESTGAIEFHYGPGNVTDDAACFAGNTGPMVGISQWVPEKGTQYKLLLEGLPFAPDTSLSASPVYLEGIPWNEQYYYFEPELTTGIESGLPQVPGPYINHESGRLVLYFYSSNSQVHFRLFDTKGSLIEQFELTSQSSGNLNKVIIPTQRLAPGSFYLQYHEKGKAFTLPFVWHGL